MDLEAQWNKILDVYSEIPLDGSISLLTGPNGSGKSLIRSQLFSRLRDEVRPDCHAAHASMELRTASYASMGALSGMTRDDSWLPTGQQTARTIRQIVKMAIKGKHFICIDEPEIGCAEETELAIAALLNELLRPAIQDGAIGALVVTHSRHVARALDHDHFFNLGEFDTLEKWLNREIVPADLAEIEENALFFYIRDQKKE